MPLAKVLITNFYNANYIEYKTKRYIILFKVYLKVLCKTVILKDNFKI